MTLFGNVPPEEMIWIRSGSFLLKSKTEMLPLAGVDQVEGVAGGVHRDRPLAAEPAARAKNRPCYRRRGIRAGLSRRVRIPRAGSRQPRWSSCKLPPCRRASAGRSPRHRQQHRQHRQFRRSAIQLSLSMKSLLFVVNSLEHGLRPESINRPRCQCVGGWGRILTHKSIGTAVAVTESAESRVYNTLSVHQTAAPGNTSSQPTTIRQMELHRQRYSPPEVRLTSWHSVPRAKNVPTLRDQVREECAH